MTRETEPAGWQLLPGGEVKNYLSERLASPAVWRDPLLSPSTQNPEVSCTTGRGCENRGLGSRGGSRGTGILLSLQTASRSPSGSPPRSHWGHLPCRSVQIRQQGQDCSKYCRCTKSTGLQVQKPRVSSVRRDAKAHTCEMRADHFFILTQHKQNACRSVIPKLLQAMFFHVRAPSRGPFPSEIPMLCSWSALPRWAPRPVFKYTWYALSVLTPHRLPLCSPSSLLREWTSPPSLAFTSGNPIYPSRSRKKASSSVKILLLCLNLPNSWGPSLLPRTSLLTFFVFSVTLEEVMFLLMLYVSPSSFCSPYSLGRWLLPRENTVRIYMDLKWSKLVISIFVNRKQLSRGAWVA